MAMHMTTCLMEIALCETFAGVDQLFLETHLHVFIKKFLDPMTFLSLYQ